MPDCLHAALYACVIVVIVGVTLEGWEHLDDWRKKGWHPGWPKIGFGLLVMGLAGELIFALLIDRAAERIRLDAQRAVGKLNVKSGALKREPAAQTRD